MKTEKKFGWLDLIVGMMFIFVSFIIFQNPTATLASFVYIYAIIALVKGIRSFVSYFVLRKDFGRSSGTLILIGILDILVGVLLFSNVIVGVISIAILLPIWLLITSVIGLSGNKVVKLISKPLYWIRTVFYILSIVISIMMMFEPVTSIFAFSFLLAFATLNLGVIYIIEAFEGSY